MPLAAGFDSNGDGLLSIDEVRGAMQRVMGVTVRGGGGGRGAGGAADAGILLGWC